jgi:FkbM family methyltransferase
VSLRHATRYDRDLRSFFGRHYDAWWLAPLRRGVEHLHHALNWSNNDSSSNGETEVIDLLPTSPTVIDVGAHVGEWTDLVLARRPLARVLQSEACPDQRAELVRNYSTDARVFVYRTGLAETTGRQLLKRYPEGRLNSTVDYPHPLPSSWLEVEMTAGDEFLAELGIEHVDLLKIDTEGSELSIIKGFSANLDAGRIDRVQLEYGRANIYSHSLLYDIYKYLTARDFVLGRVTRRRIHAQPYHPDLETFFVANYLATHRKCLM